MNEEFLVYLWTYQLFKPNLISSSGEVINVISPGSRNTDSGPDFFNAKMMIDNTQWAGNVEIHVNSSDWFKHKHQTNPSYNNIILHVVFNDDMPVYRKNSELIPTMVLKHNFSSSILENYVAFQSSKNSIPCHDLIHNIKHFDKLSWFDRLMAERLEKKSDEIYEFLELTKNNFLQIFYQRLARSLGYTTNADAMEMLASSLPLKLLLKHMDDLMQIEALLYGQAGLLSDPHKDKYPAELKKEYDFLKSKYKLQPMDSNLWRFMRMRPVSFPTIRISQLANIIYNSSGLLNKILESEKLQSVISLLSATASHYWINHYRFDTLAPGKTKMLGLSTINIILINTIIPIMFVYGKMKNNHSIQERAFDWLSEIKAESNSITNKFLSMGIKAENALQSQAMLQLEANYCSKKRCLSCRFGHLLLNRE
ncbi:MAG: hypothetical protein CL661_06370 [Bacteroidetes bacterium]|jgi:hypothetical protein|nr:hypothetical protein [Bacteroidota bacterium]|tara:strand:+ start:835 stop:2106 length:1272 start_codon:yes stop_codon:yes gene_type:complete